MPDLEINLDEEIEELRKRQEELRLLKDDPPGPSADEKTDQRETIESWKNEIIEKILSLSRIRANKNAAEVTVTGLTAEQIEKTKEAMHNLHRVIQREEVFAEIEKIVTTILDSAETLINTGNQGIATQKVSIPIMGIRGPGKQKKRIRKKEKAGAGKQKERIPKSRRKHNIK